MIGCITSLARVFEAAHRWRRHFGNKADALVGGDKAWLIIDDTALP
jgi:hypothetical protein